MDDHNISYNIVKEEYCIELQEEENVEEIVVSDEEDVSLISDNDDELSVGDAEDLVQFEITEIEQKTESELLMCLICEKTFPKLQQLKTHMLVHQGNETKTFKCPHCPEVFDVKKLLTRHLTIHQNCDTDDTDGDSENELAKRTFNCSKCDTVCETERGLKSHMRMHTPGSIFHTCTWTSCKKKFISRNILMQHIQKEHYGMRAAPESPNRPFVCTICHHSFPMLHKLKRHMNVHSDLKPFVCDVCGQRFKRIDYLQDHSTKHDEVSKTCPYCNNLYATADSLRKHIIRHHKILVRSFQCSLCTNTYNNAMSLQKHFKTHIPAKEQPSGSSSVPQKSRTRAVFTCEICDKCFNSRKGLDLHTKVHHFKPKIQVKANPILTKEIKIKLENIFPIKTDVKKAIAKPQSNQYQCLECDRPRFFKKRMSYNKHMRNHVKANMPERPFECTQCDFKFKRKCHMEDHMQIHEENRRMFNCEICNEVSYKCVKSQRLHIMKVHPTYCKYCQKEIGSKILVRQHIKQLHARYVKGKNKE